MNMRRRQICEAQCLWSVLEPIPPDFAGDRGNSNAVLLYNLNVLIRSRGFCDERLPDVA
jgi:hypothetical protein